MRYALAFNKVLSAACGLLCALMVASCSTFGDKKPAEPQVDPNIYPTKYESYIILFMRDYLKNSADYAGVSISAPALKPFDSVSRYVVCVRLDSQGGQEKIAIFNGGTMSQFIDATPQYCGGVAYRHFTELEAARPK